MKWETKTDMPFAQGWAINEVIGRYKIPAKKWAYKGSHIGVSTKKQKLLWRDKGGELEFLGIVNEEDLV